MSHSERKTNLFLALGTFAFLGLITLYVLEFPYLSNTRHIGRLVRNSFITASIVAIIFVTVGYLTKILNPKSLRLHIFFVISFVLFAPFFGSYTNRKLATSQPFSESYEYIGQKGYFVQMFGKKKGQPADTYWIYLRKNGKEYTFRTHGTMPTKIAGTGSRVRLVMQKGFWGFVFFDGWSWEFI
ncbi:MAG TPA: hypothetical protein ENK85_02685 [Saprospiraceae bacterium]|nr:hypothetical protein [Saprospiraceae bacterium]